MIQQQTSPDLPAVEDRLAMALDAAIVAVNRSRRATEWAAPLRTVDVALADGVDCLQEMHTAPPAGIPQSWPDNARQRLLLCARREQPAAIRALRRELGHFIDRRTRLEAMPDPGTSTNWV